MLGENRNVKNNVKSLSKETVSVNFIVHVTTLD